GCVVVRIGEAARALPPARRCVGPGGGPVPGARGCTPAPPCRPRRAAEASQRRDPIRRVGRGRGAEADPMTRAHALAGGVAVTFFTASLALLFPTEPIVRRLVARAAPPDWPVVFRGAVLRPRGLWLT